MTDSLTNSKGVTFRVGDAVVAKGSKVERVIVSIDVTSNLRGQLQARRTDGGSTAKWAYLDAEATALVA